MREHVNTLRSQTALSVKRTIAIGLVAGLVSFAPLGAFSSPDVALAAPTAASKQAEASAALDKLNALQVKLDEASDNYFTCLAEQEAAQARMDEAQKRIDEATAQIEKLQDHLMTRARSMYRSGSASFLDLLLGATDFQSFTTNWDLLNDMNQNDADMVSETKTLKAEVEKQKEEYAAQEKVARAKAEEAAQVKAEAEALVAESRAVYENLNAEANALLEQERAAREAAAAAAAASVVQASAASAGGGGGRPSRGYSSSTGNAIVDRAYGSLGAAYAWGATGMESFDCSGFVGYCLTGSTGRIYTSSTLMGYAAVSDPQPGDVCVNAGHCGIYIGNNQMIHAATEGVGVVVGAVQSGMKIVRP